MEHTSRIVRLVDAYDDREHIWKVIGDGGPHPFMMSLAGFSRPSPREVRATSEN